MAVAFVAWDFPSRKNFSTSVLKVTLFSVVHILDEPFLALEDNKGMAGTLQKFDKEDSERAEVYDTLSKVKHVQHSFRNIHSAQVVLSKFSIQKNGYGNRRDLVSVFPSWWQ